MYSSNLMCCEMVHLNTTGLNDLKSQRMLLKYDIYVCLRVAPPFPLSIFPFCSGGPGNAPLSTSLLWSSY